MEIVENTPNLNLQNKNILNIKNINLEPNIIEQDKNSLKNIENALNNSNIKEKTGEQPLPDGSPLGKFKDVESLKNAYENLEKEFTRKSQLLSSLQKQEEMQGASTNNLFDKKEWKGYVENFLQENPRAKEYAKELSNLILQDKVIAESQNPLHNAWLKFLEQQLVNNQNYLESETNFNQVLKNNKVRDAVIKDYLKQVNSTKPNVPTFINSNNGVNFENQIKSATTLEEAKELAKKIFSK